MGKVTVTVAKPVSRLCTQDMVSGDVGVLIGTSCGVKHVLRTYDGKFIGLEDTSAQWPEGWKTTVENIYRKGSGTKVEIEL